MKRWQLEWFRGHWRQLIGALFLLFSVSLFISRHYCARLGVEIWLQSKCPVEGGWKVHYDQLSWEGWGLSLWNLKVENRNKDFKLKTKRLNFYGRHRAGFSFDYGILFEEPMWTLKSSERATAFTYQDVVKAFSNMRIDVDKGVLKLIDEEEVTPLYFSLIGEENRRTLGSFICSEREELELGGELRVQLYQWPGDLVVEIEVEEGSLPWLTKIHSFFQPKGKVCWKVDQGVINGHIWMGLQRDNSVREMTAMITLVDIAASHALYGLDVKTEKVTLDLAFPKGKRRCGRSLHSLVAGVLLKSQVEGGRITFKDAEQENAFAIVDILGKFQLGSLRDSEIQLEGLALRKGTSFPLRLRGHPHGTDQDKLDLDLQLVVEPEQQYSTHLELSIGMEEAEEWVIRGHLREMGVEQVTMLQHMVGFAYPEIREVELKEGSISCELSLRFIENELRKIFLEHVVAEGLEVYAPSSDISAKCSYLAGRAECDLTALPHFPFPSWQLQMRGGALCKGGETATPLEVSELQVAIAMEANIFAPSWIEAVHNGITGRVDIAGPRKEPNLYLQLASDGEHAFSYVGSDGVDLAALRAYQCETALYLYPRSDHWEVLGEATLISPALQRDSIHFGCQLREGLLLKEFNQISKGWFRATEISSEPVRFLNKAFKQSWDVEGRISLEGRFEPTHVDLEFETASLALLSDKLDITLHRGAEGESALRSKGSFSYDGVAGSFEGSLPIYHGICHEKWLNLQFCDIAAQLSLKNGILLLEKIQAESEGILFEGELRLDCSDMKDVGIEISTHGSQGSVKQVERFLHHFPELVDLSIPFDGRMQERAEGSEFKGRLREEGSLFTGDLHVEVMHGSYAANEKISLQDLSFNLDWKVEGSSLIVTDLWARCLSEKVDEGFAISGKKISVHERELRFDLRFENSIRDLIRLVGRFDREERKLTLDHQYSHLFGSRLEAAALEWGLDGSVLYGLLDWHLPCPDFTEYVELATYFATPFESRLESRLWIKPLFEQMAGRAHVRCQWDQGSFNALIESPEQVKFVIAQEENSWHLKEGRLGDWGLRGYLRYLDDSLFFHDCDITHTKGSATIESGTYQIKEGKGTIERVHYLLEAAAPLPASAYVEGRGGISYSREEGLILKEHKLSLKSKGESFFTCEVPKLQAELHVDGYRIEGKGLKGSLSEKTAEYCIKERLIDKQSAAYIPLNAAGAIEVLFDLNLSNEDLVVQGSLKADSYGIHGIYHPFREISFSAKRDRCSCSFESSFKDREFHVEVAALLKNNLPLTVKAYEMSAPGIAVLEMEGSLMGSRGPSLTLCKGNLFGLDFDLLPQSRKEDRESAQLIAKVKIDVDGLKPLLSKELLDFVEGWELHKGYELQGELTFLKKQWRGSSFTGYMSGKDVDLLGYQIKSLLGKIHIDGQKIAVDDLKMCDDALSAEVKKIVVQEEASKNWLLEIPEVKIIDLRPSLLRKRDTPPMRTRPFHITEMVFSDITGSCSDMKSLTGKGHLHFVNTFRQDHNLLDIPIEIISRLGLDIGLLVPIQGEMDSIIKNGKVVFTKLKNSFSDSKRSYFYLSPKGESYVDFRGNMHINIRMKQYVLFKITEFFVLSVEGTLEKPSFSLK